MSENKAEKDIDIFDTREGPARYAAYAARVKKLFAVKAAAAAKAAGNMTRYVAYSSDIGEAMRPVLTPAWVKAAYGIAFAYVGADVTYHGYKAQQEGGDVQRTVTHAFVFQSLASLAAPTLIIHTTVHTAQKICKQLGRFTKWGPTIAGLALIPALPSAVDEPIEHAVDYAFEKYWPEGEVKATKAHEE
ncbi:hypothetical protein CYMTET_32969 [Cymbomonas tetramitiformis]|uniref:Mitochondrial fission process protein 1 n=1 Tax=Cymbomonas tetramitiformis TaxID=36881 RepID=A0AAE0FDU5_9CHLO|nr:hypothetical protein CYMTET_32969 [Cymbomonas tetramitiformis]